MLENSAQWLTYVLDTMDEGIHVVDKLGVTMVYNQAASRLDGVPSAEVLGRHVLSVFPSLGQETSTLLQVLKSGKSIHNQPQTYTNIMGKKVHTVNTTLPIFSGQTLIGALEIAKDMTQVKHLSDLVMSLQEQVASVKRRGVNRQNEGKSSFANYTFADFLTTNPDMENILRRAEKSARTTSPILVYGETGTGKELLVQSIHNASPRSQHPFLAVNCAALPASLLEGILFGTVRGSFTGSEDRAGLFELTTEGTLFLDEVQSLPLELQAKLLRVLQEGEFYRVGDSQVRTSGARVVAAMNVLPEDAVETGMMRKDLYYRLNVVRLDLLPLRHRREDILLLTQAFIRKWNQKFGTSVTGIDVDAETRFMTYYWPGNVRELENSIESALNQIDSGEISLDVLPQRIRLGDSRGEGVPLYEVLTHFENTQFAQNSAHAEKLAHDLSENFEESDSASWVDELIHEGMAEFWASIGSPQVRQSTMRSSSTMLEVFERMILSRTLNTYGWNVKKTSEYLQIPRQTLQYRIKHLNLSK